MSSFSDQCSVVTGQQFKTKVLRSRFPAPEKRAGPTLAQDDAKIQNSRGRGVRATRATR
jgi:hypothetical protein